MRNPLDKSTKPAPSEKVKFSCSISGEYVEKYKNIVTAIEKASGFEVKPNEIIEALIDCTMASAPYKKMNPKTKKS
jgi:hypothetical protein